MSATELATVVEGWATVAGLFVVIAGAVFAGVELRADSRSRRLQALIDLYSVVWPKEMPGVMGQVLSLPDDFDFDQLEQTEKDAVMLVTVSMSRTGYFLRNGLIREDELFGFAPFNRPVILTWDKVKHVVRGGVPRSMAVPEGVHNNLDFEYLAWRAQAYMTTHGVDRFAAVPIFNPDIPAVDRVSQEAQQIRVLAN